jgi:hypothetical protein
MTSGVLVLAVAIRCEDAISQTGASTVFRLRETTFHAML